MHVEYPPTHSKILRLGYVVIRSNSSFVRILVSSSLMNVN
jgi:hypothetical protein